MTINHLKAILSAAFLAEGTSDTGCDSLNKIQALALQVGATSFETEEGACSFEVTGPEAAAELIAALDDEDAVEAYDVMHDAEDAADDADILTLPEGTKFAFVVYCGEDYVTYDGEDVGSDDLDESAAGDVSPFARDNFGTAHTLDEVKKRMKVNFKGKKTVKMQCPPGFRYDAEKKSCMKIGGAELATRRKASVRALVTRKAGGEALKKRANVRTKKAMNFRKSMGLK